MVEVTSMTKSASKRASSEKLSLKSFYRYRVVKRSLTMPDGLKLAATLWMPCAKRRGETFPVLLEYLPYRKDDTFYVGDYPCFSYLTQLGFISVKVDIRGTGASEGAYPDREYSDIEMQDGEEVIRQLAALPQSNGNVGMFGVSWSGFNSLQMAMRRPPALKAIHAVHASDDLFHDDVHYIDGNLHLDPYHLFINHELGLPRTPGYELDASYFRQRFDKEPWIFTYLSNQSDGEFWRRKSLREDYSRINIPVYLMGGLLDGYRTATVRMFQKLKGDVRCDIGPWNHSCPDDGTPGPNWEWLDRMAAWFRRYLLPGSAESLAWSKAKKRKEFMVFVREGHAADKDIETVPGYFHGFDYPLKGTRRKKYQLTSAVVPAVQSLSYKAFGGTAAGTWWGDTTGDMARDDAESLIWESAPLKRANQIVGFPTVKLKVSASSPTAKWTVRLEDVAPDGTVALVTGRLFNPAFLKERLNPALPAADQWYELNGDLHFTTWTFKPGHKIRLAVSNAQLIMCWPSPDRMVGRVDFGASLLSLPVVPAKSREQEVKDLPAVKSKRGAPFSEGLWYPQGKPESEVKQRRRPLDQRSSERSHTIVSRQAFRIKERKFFIENSNSWAACNEKPWAARYTGRATTSMVSQGRHVQHRTIIRVVSDKTKLNVSVTRYLSVNGRNLRKRHFKQVINRQFN